MLGAMNALSELENTKREDNTIKDIKNILRLKKEIHTLEKLNPT